MYFYAMRPLEDELSADRDTSLSPFEFLTAEKFKSLNYNQIVCPFNYEK